MIKSKFLGNFIFLIISFILFFITIIFNKKFLDVQPHMIYHILSLFILIYIGQYINNLINKIKEKDEKTLIFIKCFLVYFTINILFYIILYPGIYTGEDLLIFSLNPHQGEIYIWYNWITNLYYSLSITLTSSIIGIVPIQFILISIITAYFISETYMLIRNKYVFLIFIPFLFPTVIMMNFYTFRFTIVSFLLFFIFSKFIFKYLSNEKFKFLEIIYMAILSAIIIIWRAEFCLNILLFPLYFYLLFFKRIENSKIIIYSLILVTLAVSGIFYQWHTLKKQDLDKQYLLSSVHGTGLRLIDISLRDKNIQKNKKWIKYSTDIDFIISYFHNVLEDNSKSKPDNEFKNIKTDYIINTQRKILLIFTPEIIFNALTTSNNLKEFLVSNEEINGRENKYFRTTDKNWELIPKHGILGNKLRLIILSVLDCTYYNQKFENKNPLFYFFYNMGIPYFFIFLCLIIGIFRRNKLIFCTSAILTINFLILFLTTACTSMFYYNYPYYICSWAFFSLFIYILINKFQKIK